MDHYCTGKFDITIASNKELRKCSGRKEKYINRSIGTRSILKCVYVQYSTTSVFCLMNIYMHL